MCSDPRSGPLIDIGFWIGIFFAKRGLPNQLVSVLAPSGVKAAEKSAGVVLLLTEAPRERIGCSIIDVRNNQTCTTAVLLKKRYTGP